MAYKNYEKEQDTLQTEHLNAQETSNNNSENNVPVQEEVTPKQENIPKLSAEEKSEQEKWRNSSEMQTGLNAMLPKTEANTNPSTNKDKNEATGIPQNLKEGIERLSGMSLDDITVHYNSNLPAKYNALAYAEGSDIYIAPNQEEHLPHELAHIVQQKEGRVKATGKVNGLDINTDESFEKDADQMADQVLKKSENNTKESEKIEPTSKPNLSNVMQQEGEEGSWEVPREGVEGAVTTVWDAAVGMSFIAYDLNQLKGSLPDGSNSSDIDELLIDIEGWIAYLGDQDGGSSLDSFFTIQMNRFNSDYRSAYESGMELVRQPSLAAVRSLRGGTEIEPMDDDTQDALRAAFSSESEDSLSQISSLIASIEAYNSRINQFTGYIGHLGESIRGASTISMINEITGNIGDVAERIQQVITTIQSLGTLLDATNQAATESMQTINDMEATFNAIDMGMSFAKGMPVLSSLWSSYYMPAIEICLSGIRQIAALRSEQVHDLVELNIQTRTDQSTAPSLRGSEQHFSGGQAVFDFMWQVMLDNEVEPSQEVHSYFSDREDLFTAGTDREMTVTGASLTDFWEDNKVKNLYWYCKANSERIWAMLYGSRITAP